MGRKSIISLLAATAVAAPALAERSTLNAAIDAWLQDDFRQMHVIERHAEAGDASAMGVLGQACFYGLGCTRDRPRALDLMTRAAESGDLPSMVLLGRIFEYGSSDVPADPAQSAKWFLSASEAGDTISAPAGLRRLPRETVIAADGSAWLEDGDAPVPLAAPPTPAPPASPLAVQSPSPGPDPAAAPPPPPPPAPAAEPPALLRLSDGREFPLYACTPLGLRGDLAASCFIDLDPAIEDTMTELESLMALHRTQGAIQQAATLGRIDVARSRARSIMLAQDTAHNTLKSVVEDGALTEGEIHLHLSRHIEAQERRPETGPGAEMCRQHYLTLDSALMLRKFSR
jgi:hypothetical protein